jgi:catechol 2,3-dioxygenase-like lactoylglutathione lyase family enzyme
VDIEHVGLTVPRPQRSGSGRGKWGSMSESLNNVSAMSLFVEDVPAAKRFYQDVFDAPVVYEDDVSAAVKFDHLVINLLHSSQAPELVAPAPVATPGAGSRFQLSIWVDDVDAVCAQLDERGVKLLTGPEDKPWGMRAATFTDPSGHSWEVAQRLDT